MDPIIELNNAGYGQITFYHFGVSYKKVKVHRWVVQPFEYLPTKEDPVVYAQKLVNRYHANLPDNHSSRATITEVRETETIDPLGIFLGDS